MTVDAGENGGDILNEASIFIWQQTLYVVVLDKIILKLQQDIDCANVRSV